MRSINLKVHPLILAAAAVIAVPAIAIAAGTVLTPPVTATGTSTAPILTATNNSSGPALQGVSAKGKGVVGQTKFNSTSTANEQTGVSGQDLSTSGTFNAGIRGFSNNGTGVDGYSNHGDGVTGTSQSGTHAGLSGTGNTGVSGSGSSFGVSGEARTGGTGYGAGVYGIGNDTAFFGESVAGGYLFTGFSMSTGNYVFEVDDSGNVYAHSFNATLSPNVIQPKSSGGTVNTYTNQTASPSVEDVGEGAMVAGTATIRFDPAFSQIMDQSANYSVVITPEGDSNGLYVMRKTSAGFAVRENRGGRSTLTFGYRVVARPFGNRGQRLPVVIQRPAPRLPKHVPQIPSVR